MKILSSYLWKDLKYSISAFFRPRNKWASRLIPKKFCDKPELIKDFLFAALVHYVEEEKALEDWTEEEIAKMPEHQRNCILECRELYPLIKSLPGLQEKNSKEFYVPFDGGQDCFLENFNCPERNKKLQPFLEESARLEKLEQEICERIVKIRESLWT